jgi:hypothetical protein
MGLRNLFARRQTSPEAVGADDFIHVVGTKFGIGVFNEQWLEYRQELFEVLTLPSLDAQTERNFTWVLGIDRDMPERFRKRLDELVESRPYIRLLELELFGDFEPEFIKWCKKEAAAQGRSHILTTRIDNDDALHVDLFGEIHRTAREVLSGGAKLPAAIMATTGYQWVPATGEGFRAFHFSHSMGTSLLETVDDFEMVYTKNHRKVPDWAVEKDGSVRAIDGDTRWWLYATTNTSVVILRVGTSLRDSTLANPGIEEISAETMRQFGVTQARRLRDVHEPTYVANHKELDERGKRLDNNIRQVRQQLRKQREAGKPEDPELLAKHAELHEQRKENARAWIA